jgi:hypothetical protein
MKIIGEASPKRFLIRLCRRLFSGKKAALKYRLTRENRLCRLAILRRALGNGHLSGLFFHQKLVLQISIGIFDLANSRVGQHLISPGFAKDLNDERFGPGYS